jgi:endonuclease/exonuclease/phosphatase family metal-dependent hydrolase
VRILTYNIWDGGIGRLPLIEAVIRSQSPDVVALQEVTDRAAAEGLAARLGMRAVHGDANSRWAIAWLTSQPVKRAENYRLPELAKTLLEVEVQGVRLFATHLVHGRNHAADAARTREVEVILDVLAHVSGPHVLVGDLNAVHPEDEVGMPPAEERLEHVSRRPLERLLEAGYVDCFRTLNPTERGWTYLAAHPWARLDYVLTKGVDALECRVVADAPAVDASDHLAVAAQLR